MIVDILIGITIWILIGLIGGVIGALNKKVLLFLIVLGAFFLLFSILSVDISSISSNWNWGLAIGSLIGGFILEPAYSASYNFTKETIEEDSFRSDIKKAKRLNRW